MASQTIPAHWSASESLAQFTTWRVGGPAKYISHPVDVKELRADLSLARSLSLPLLVIGGGSNLLFPDTGFDGLIIRLPKTWLSALQKSLTPSDAHAVAKYYQETCLTGDDKIAHLAAGARLASTAREQALAGYSGLEWAEGIPGSIGGGIVNNAGAYGGSLGQSLAQALILDSDGTLACWSKADFNFAYRSSKLKNKMPTKTVILMAAFHLFESDPIVLSEKMREIKEQREKKLPRESSCGCVFKNPPGEVAGRLIQDAGLGGLKIGGGEVSKQHGNFILNTNAATAENMLQLIRKIRKTVHESTGLNLQLEVQLVGFPGEIEQEIRNSY